MPTGVVTTVAHTQRDVCVTVSAAVAAEGTGIVNIYDFYIQTYAGRACLFIAVLRRARVMRLTPVTI